MKFTFIISKFGKGGMEKVLYNLCSALKKKSIDIEIITFYINKDNNNILKQFKEFNVIYKPLYVPRINDKQRNLFSSFIKFFNSIYFLKRYIKLNNNNIIVALDPWAIDSCIIAKGFKKLPKIYGWLHFPIDVYSKHKLWKIHKFFIKRLNGILAICNGIKSQLVNEGIDENKILISYNPMGFLKDFYIKEALNPTFIYVGRLKNQPKRLDLLLDAFSKLKKYNWKVKIIGDGEDKEYLEELAKTKGINHRIEWCGFIDDPWSFIHEATALLLTSDYEGFPTVLIEANWYGIPVISTDCPTGPKEIVVEGLNGTLVKKGNSEDLAEKIKKVIRGEIKFATKEEIRKTTERYHSDYVVEKILDFIN
ncbi:glycosyltransferase [Thermoanaerobacterium thermosaccharolyticum]|uniref:glycosyltransferase n=2 Tax=Thermoanaerobacterium thermosaccharolyticum TaxID=1517 RepID=UPI003DA82094